MRASSHARYDAAKRAEMDARIEHERGLLFSYDPLFNSLVPESWSAFNAGVDYHPEQVSAALPQTELRWRPVPRNGTPIRFGLNQIDDRLLLDLWSADTGQVPRAEMEALLLAIERLLVAAAHSDLDASEVIGLGPIVRGPEWILIDSCWADLTEVQRLLDEALGVARIFPSEGGRSLVCYLAATDSVRTPEQAHARCMAALPGYPTAITPRHYVVCETAPPDPTNLATWPPALISGTGRTS
jgi:hypothetical protein